MKQPTLILKNNLFSPWKNRHYIIKLDKNSALVKNLSKLTDVVMDKNGISFPDQTKLAIELQSLTESLLALEINNGGEE